jgi:hypothetical protein
MKTTQYFEFIRKRPYRALITIAWIKMVIKNPEKMEIQSDSRIRKWARIPETGKYFTGYLA